MAIDPAGRFAYVGNDTEQVSVFSVDRATGALTSIDGSPFAAGGLQPEIVVSGP